jgi:protein-S-isoprenylcysteine O-methyltransferase Ste14
VHFTWLDPLHLLGVVFIVLGVGLLAACIWEFAHRDRGTLAPLDPPRQLVVQGLYRYVRNPMYLSVTTIVFGELLLTRSLALLTYWAIWFAAVNLFVIGYEEPALRRQFGASYDRYTQTVGRWIPSLRSRGASLDIDGGFDVAGPQPPLAWGKPIGICL